MEVLHPRCCGLDVHKETVVACVRLVIDGKLVKEVRTFSTTTASSPSVSCDKTSDAPWDVPLPGLVPAIKVIGDAANFSALHPRSAKMGGRRVRRLIAWDQQEK